MRNIKGDIKVLLYKEIEKLKEFEKLVDRFGTSKIYIKNQLPGTIDFCAGMNEYQLGPEQEVVVPVEDGDCIYLDLYKSDKDNTQGASGKRK